MAEALTGHSVNIEQWVDKQGLAIYAPKSPIILFTPQFAQSNTHTQVILNNSILPFDFRPSLQIQYPCQIFSHPGLTPYQHPQGPYWYQLGSAKINYTYHLCVPYTVPFHVCSSRMVTQHLTIPHSETPSYAKLYPPHSHRLR